MLSNYWRVSLSNKKRAMDRILLTDGREERLGEAYFALWEEPAACQIPIYRPPNVA